MSNQRLPNEEEIETVSDVEEPLNHHNVQGLQEELPTTTTLLANEEEENAEDVVASTNEANEEKSSSSSSDADKDKELPGEELPAKPDPLIEPHPDKEQDAARQEQQQVMPTMSPEQVLLLQVLRRAKRQQDLIIEIQKNLKSLTNIQKGIEKTTEQVKQLQSAFKDSQKQTMQIQRQIAGVERAQEKGFEKLRTQKRGGGGGALISIKGKAAKNRGKRKKIR
jgi:hypothetical protein